VPVLPKGLLGKRIVYISEVMYRTKYVSTNIRLTVGQHRFLQNSEYCLSKLVRKTVEKLMEKSQ
jgi:hypothetical protein